MKDKRKRIAIVGSGISGLTAAYILNKKHDITVFEANDYIGGHTATKQVEHNNTRYNIDTGFIVFNDWTYPNFIRLMDELGVEKQKTEMSFSVKNTSENIEYNGHNLNSLFAQRRNLLRPKFLHIVKDIIKFNKVCKQVIEDKTDTDGLTLFDFIQHNKLSQDFANNYILPMCAAIWSASLDDVKQFPLTFFLQFFNNHGLLNIKDRPQWYTLVGGSSSYIEPLTSGFKQKIKLNSPVSNVHQLDGTWYLSTKGGIEEFDSVIFACHSDQALTCLSNPSSVQKAVLGAIPYSDNEVVLHTDESVLPKRKRAWASWNYELRPNLSSGLAHKSPASVTYNMNILQRLATQTTFCVTLNNTAAIDPKQILGRYNYTHPQYSKSMVKAQSKRSEVTNQNGLHFCGAYWYSGFHEDGVKSALDVCRDMGEQW
ncbi:FAD-dependent oxidoreductase [Alteromonas sp. 5E99-2]|uniref:NAD(P)/FAD-dependent oxidoreductase n=1 Tax=Alteromonas sp. 5E99-2 TaxID=2817683 RepID=UPI001A9961CE|nr:FAD-dependent oxidoreductase [Alteromonas sp. 5E99-2]MBO1255272.1 FAD-dependent oxidoreductase [Alteromonas sp. 5E99-2]